MGNFRKYFVYIIVGIWFFLLVLLLPRHELWYEEAHGWLFARDSSSLVNLYQNLTYEAHPMMWYSILFGVTRITDNFYYMQLAHIAIALIGIVVFCRYAPFRLLDKILFIFGYFVFFEYAVISRNYGLTVLLLFIYCAWYAQRFRRLYLTALIVGLLGQTSPVGFLFSLVLGCFLFGEYIWIYRKKVDWRILVISLFCFVSLSGTALLKLLPPVDRSYTLDSYTHFDLQRVALSSLMVWRGMIPIPHFGLHFWNTNIVMPVQNTESLSTTQYVSIGIAIGLVGLFILYSCLLLVKRRVLLGLYLGAASVLFLLFYTTYYGAVRHYGFFFILFICIVWLRSFYPEREDGLSVRSEKMYKAVNRIFPPFFTVLLSVHFVCGIYAYYADFNEPFMTSKDVSDYLKTSQLDRLPISVDFDYAMTPIAIYLNRHLYYPRSDTVGTYVVMNTDRQAIDQSEVVRRSLAHLGGEGVMLLNYRLDNPSCFELRKVFEKSLAYQDTVYIYYVSKDCLDSHGEQ